MTALQIQNLSYSYGDMRILSDISFDVKPGELISILGHNGSGKTTLLRCVSGYLKPERGQALLGGKNVISIPAKTLAQRMALVPQSSVMEFDFTVRDIVLMGRNPHIGRFAVESEADYALADDALRWTNMFELKDRSVLTLSGGEWQRTIVARAICQNSEVLLLDEPVANLDIKHQLDILGMVRRVCRERGVCALCVMHDVNLAAHYSDKLIILNRGEMLCFGTSETVITSENLFAAYGVKADVRQEQGAPFMVPEYRGQGY